MITGVRRTHVSGSLLLAGANLPGGRRQFPARENQPCIGFSSTTVVSPVSRPGLFIQACLERVQTSALCSRPATVFPASAASDCRGYGRFPNLAGLGGISTRHAGSAVCNDRTLGHLPGVLMGAWLFFTRFRLSKSVHVG